MASTRCDWPLTSWQRPHRDDIQARSAAGPSATRIRDGAAGGPSAPPTATARGPSRPAGTARRIHATPEDRDPPGGSGAALPGDHLHVGARHRDDERRLVTFRHSRWRSRWMSDPCAVKRTQAGQSVDDQPCRRRVVREVAVNVGHAVGDHAPCGVGDLGQDREARPQDEPGAAPAIPDDRPGRPEVGARPVHQPPGLRCEDRRGQERQVARPGDEVGRARLKDGRPLAEQRVHVHPGARGLDPRISLRTKVSVTFGNRDMDVGHVQRRFAARRRHLASAAAGSPGRTAGMVEGDAAEVRGPLPGSRRP